MQEICNLVFCPLIITVIRTVIIITVINCLLMGILHPYFAKKMLSAQFPDITSKPD